MSVSPPPFSCWHVRENAYCIVALVHKYRGALACQKYIVAQFPICAHWRSTLCGYRWCLLWRQTSEIWCLKAPWSAQCASAFTPPKLVLSIINSIPNLIKMRANLWNNLIKSDFNGCWYVRVLTFTNKKWVGLGVGQHSFLRGQRLLTLTLITVYRVWYQMKGKEI